MKIWRQMKKMKNSYYKFGATSKRDFIFNSVNQKRKIFPERMKRSNGKRPYRNRRVVPEKTTGEAPISLSHRNREVWSYNLREELELLKEYLPEFPIVAIDTEFPGIWLRIRLIETVI